MERQIKKIFNMADICKVLVNTDLIFHVPDMMYWEYIGARNEVPLTTDNAIIR